MFRHALIFLAGAAAAKAQPADDAINANANATVGMKIVERPRKMEHNLTVTAPAAPATPTTLVGATLQQSVIFGNKLSEFAEAVEHVGEDNVEALRFNDAPFTTGMVLADPLIRSAVSGGGTVGTSSHVSVRIFGRHFFSSAGTMGCYFKFGQRNVTGVVQAGGANDYDCTIRGAPGVLIEQLAATGALACTGVVATFRAANRYQPLEQYKPDSPAHTVTFNYHPSSAKLTAPSYELELKDTAVVQQNKLVTFPFAVVGGATLLSDLITTVSVGTPVLNSDGCNADFPFLVTNGVADGKICWSDAAGSDATCDGWCLKPEHEAENPGGHLGACPGNICGRVPEITSVTFGDNEAASSDGSATSISVLFAAKPAVKEYSIIVEVADPLPSVGNINATFTIRITPGACNTASWSHKDHGLVCGDCKVLADRFNSIYKDCNTYCSMQEGGALKCKNAFDEIADTCQEKPIGNSDNSPEENCATRKGSSDAICECEYI